MHAVSRIEWSHVAMYIHKSEFDHENVFETCNLEIGGFDFPRKRTKIDLRCGELDEIKKAKKKDICF